MIRLARIPLYLLLLSLACTSCSTVPAEPVTFPVRETRRSSVNHVVGPGETLWRISKIYDVPVATIMRVNQLRSKELTMGSNLNIPGAKKPRQEISLFPSRKWRYIIIHHSATEVGNALTFHKAHQAKGWDSVGYHFVIDNGQGEKPDGFIEITPRWLKQLDGAHCKADDMNLKAIGICLVGNFNKDQPTYAQRKSLETLVKKLQKYYRISDRRVLRHGKVRGAQTECPGTKFPWTNFKQHL